MQVQAARAVLTSDPAKADAVLGKAQAQATDALAEVRRSVAALREPRATGPLAEALEVLAAETSAAGIPTVLEVTGTARELPPEAGESIFRAAQEGLTNVRKHAGARSARVVLRYGEDGTVRLDVCDDGRGAARLDEAAGFGLLGVRERAALLGGTVEIDSSPGTGTTVRMAVPG
jgi:signal transduction histidine kinase